VAAGDPATPIRRSGQLAAIGMMTESPVTAKQFGRVVGRLEIADWSMELVKRLARENRGVD
jgi:hypothetical protein